MKNLKGITINGEWLGDNVVINANFRAICNIAPFVMQEFAKLVNSINELDSAVAINNFYFPDNNTVDIEFSNANFSALAKLYFNLQQGSPVLINRSLTIYTDDVLNDEDIIHENANKEIFENIDNNDIQSEIENTQEQDEAPLSTEEQNLEYFDNIDEIIADNEEALQKEEDNKNENNTESEISEIENDNQDETFEDDVEDEIISEYENEEQGEILNEEDAKSEEEEETAAEEAVVVAEEELSLDDEKPIFQEKSELKSLSITSEKAVINAKEFVSSQTSNTDKQTSIAPQLQNHNKDCNDSYLNNYMPEPQEIQQTSWANSNPVNDYGNNGAGMNSSAAQLTNSVQNSYLEKDCENAEEQFTSTKTKELSHIEGDCSNSESDEIYENTQDELYSIQNDTDYENISEPEMSEEQKEDIQNCLSDFYDKSQNIQFQETNEDFMTNYYEKYYNKPMQSMFDDMLQMREELNMLRKEKLTYEDIFGKKEKMKNNIEDTNFRILGSKEHVVANILDEDLFVAGDKLYRWGDTLYLDE